MAPLFFSEAGLHGDLPGLEREQKHDEPEDSGCEAGYYRVR